MVKGSHDLTYNKGIVYAVACYVLWGVLPIFWKAITGIPALNILAHRMVWSFVFLIILVLFTDRRTFLDYIRRPMILSVSGIAGLLMSVNWGIFIYSVENGHIIEAGLGYYFNPLINVLLGYIFLKERLAPMQKFAVVLAFIGVAYVTLGYGKFPWISISLALSFGLYGLLKKKVNLESMPALTIETMMVFPLALGYLVYCWKTADPTPFFPHSPLTASFLLVSGVVTAVPLFWFGKAARVIPLSTLGFIQYLAPTLQLLLGIFVYGESFSREYFICFAFVWAGLIFYTVS
ncbi:MAG: EamA family transporter RarD, partial [Alistipes sp.]|nr:EamA family transporter RarD [Alistipes sp.]